jgi:hypothetical protein
MVTKLIKIIQICLWLQTGLPDRNCFDIVYRHALDKRENELIFGSTTGNIYSSHDAGNSWNPDITHLPPIYSLQLF